ncbi:hypothetical protein RhiTH_007126 [Rhizoctonia solani]
MAPANDYRPDKREAKNMLKKAFERNPHPSRKQMEAISVECGRSVETVAKWFKQEREKYGNEEKPQALGSSQSIIHEVRDRDLDSPVSEQWNIGASSEQWGQFPPSSADDIPSMAFGELHKQQHELHCAMAMYHLATQGLPMSLTHDTEA